MMENDDKLLQQFFDTHRQDIADNGFSRHVIRNLPVRVNRIGRIWTALCTVACIVFILVSGALDWLLNRIISLYGDVAGMVLSARPGLFTPFLVYGVVFGIVGFFTYKVASSDRLAIFNSQSIIHNDIPYMQRSSIMNYEL